MGLICLPKLENLTTYKNNYVLTGTYPTIFQIESYGKNVIISTDSAAFFQNITLTSGQLLATMPSELKPKTNVYSILSSMGGTALSLPIALRVNGNIEFVGTTTTIPAGTPTYYGQASFIKN